MTRKRQMILNQISSSEIPMNAHRLCERMEGELDQATVYRGLKYLEAKGMIGSFVFDCDHRGVERYYYSLDASHSHFLHCSRCHCFIPIRDCPVRGSLKGIEEEYGFRVEQHFLTLKGICRDCRNEEIRE